MKDKYIYGSDKNIIGVSGEKTENVFYFNIVDIPVLLTREKGYYNVYILDSDFKLEPMNNLNEQIPIRYKPEDWDFYLELRLIEWYLWKKYNKDFCVDEVK